MYELISLNIKFILFLINNETWPSQLDPNEIDTLDLTWLDETTKKFKTNESLEFKAQLVLNIVNHDNF